MYTDYERVYTNYLMHHGVKGMRWGVKRMLQKMGNFGNPNNQKLMNAGRKLMEGGLVAAGLGASILPVGLHYSDKQFKAENNIYARTKRSTRD